MSATKYAFDTLPKELRAQVTAAIEKDSSLENVFIQLINFFKNDADSGNGKKRKLNTGPVSTPDPAAATIIDEPSALKLPGVSVQTPIRKKLDLVLTKNALVLRKSAETAPEYVVPVTDIDSVFLLPIPEKAKPQWALIVNPATDESTNKNRSESIMVTVGEDIVKAIVKPENGELYNGTIQEILILYFQRRNISITSEATMPPNQSLIQVSAYRGSKDGYLYFLPESVFFGFKKPLLVFRLFKIISISYSSITKSTFNMIVKYRENLLENENANTQKNNADTKFHEIEFSMIDQAFFEKINQYVEFHGLDDESLAEERKAKVDAKAVFPDQLIKASRETEVNTAMNVDEEDLPEPKQQNEMREINLNTHDFGSDDDDEMDEDFNESEDDEDDD